MILSLHQAVKIYRISLPTSPLSEPRIEVPLTSSEKIQVYSTLSQVHRDLAELDDAVAHLRSVQKRLLSKREALQTFYDTHNELLCPARLMPPEILAEIFSYFKPDQYVPGWQRALGTLAAQSMVLLPASVCQQWRQITLSTPSLWNRIYLDLDRSEGRLELEWLKFWLPHSKNYPLSIVILDHGSDQDAWNAILDILLPQSGRWNRAIIQFQHETDFSRVENNLPLLETLQIKIAGNITRDLADAFQIAPLLRHVNMNVNRLRGVCQLPWTQLSSFDASKCSVRQSLALLRMMPNIVSFTVKLINEEMGHHVPNDPSIDPPLRLSKLERLDLFGPGAGINHFLDRLELPSLESFSFVEYNEDLPTGWSASLVSLIQRSSCDSIRALRITAETTGSQASVEDVIRVCPKLERLHLGSLEPSIRSGYDKVIQSLTVTSSSIGGTRLDIVPALRTIYLRYSEGLDMHSLVNMIDSRRRVNGQVAEQPVACLAIIILDVPDATVFNAVALERLRKFAAEGLYINVEATKGEPIMFDTTWFKCPFLRIVTNTNIQSLRPNLMPGPQTHERACKGP
ncbi:hypothetical protein FIBSPDRAFT_893124 [Athelia psychrophila]|uniref:F-box domain-containing protein n=1 Tax=Athelia psychrophila TaxID=1759441 RepID=A0A166HJ62_9AGAM|nr:hypothetical protein FIBSPDRAFT_893124 [Fibularhizoctonia sp. CBS 109695]